MGTFSQLVDEITGESNRPDLQSTIATYVNQTVRECHSSPKTDTPVCFAANLAEVAVTANTDTGYVWSIPDPTVFQEMKAVRYDAILDSQGCAEYATLARPGPRFGDTRLAFYRTGDGFAFKGYGGNGASLSLGFYCFLKRLKYYAPAARLAVYDYETGWTYPTGLTDPVLQAAARALMGNWMIQKWYDTVAEGARAKVYKRLSDDVRGRTAYSLFLSMRKTLVSAEAAESGG